MWGYENYTREQALTDANAGNAIAADNHLGTPNVGGVSISGERANVATTISWGETPASSADQIAAHTGGQPGIPGYNTPAPTNTSQNVAEAAGGAAGVGVNNQNDSTIAENIKAALGAGHKPDAIAAQLQELAKNTRDEGVKASLMNFAMQMFTDAGNEMSKGIGQAGLTGASNISAGTNTGQRGAFQSKQGYNMQSNLGTHFGNAINTGLAADKAANDLEFQALQREEAQKTANAQKAYFLNQPANLQNITVAGADGKSINLNELKDSNPQLFQQTMQYLSNASPEELNQFMADSGMSGLPPVLFGLEGQAEKPDWSNPLIAGAANKQEFLQGVPQELHSVYGNMSWTEIDNRIKKGFVVNPNYNPDGDNRKWIKGTASGEGAARFAPQANNLLKSDLLDGAISNYFSKDGTKNLWANIKSKVPWADERQMKAGFALVNLYQAAGITGLAGVETLTEYLDSVANGSITGDEVTYKAKLALALEDIASTAYLYGAENMALGADTLYIQKHGGKAYIDKVIGNANSSTSQVMLDPKTGKYFYLDKSGNPQWVE